MSHKLAAMVAVSVALAGCSDSDGTSTESSASGSFTPYERVAALPPQIATLEITDPLGILAPPTITINQGEGDDANVIMLDANVTTNGVDTVTIDMALVNNSDRILFNPKVVPTALSQGDIGVNTLNNTDTIEADAPNLAGLEYYGFGIRGVAEGAAVSAEDAMQINGIVSVDNGDDTVSNSPLVIQVEIPTDHSMAYHNSQDWGTIARVDVMGTRFAQQDYDDLIKGGAYSWDNNYHQGAQSPDGRYLFLGTRNLPVIMVHDTTTDMQNDLTPTIESIPLLEDPNTQGFTASVEMSPDGHFLYASVTTGNHEGGLVYGDGGNFSDKNYLIKVDTTTMEVVSRLEVTMPGHEGMRMRPRRLSIADDGRTASLVMDFAGGILLLDLDGDMSVEGSYNLLGNGYGARIKEAAISPDGSRIFFPDGHSYHNYTYDNDGIINSEGHIGVIDVDSGAFSKILASSPITSSTRQLEFGPDGRLYHVGDSTQINVYNVTSMTQVAVYDNLSYDQFAFDGEGQFLYAFGSDTDIYDISSDSFTNLSEADNAGEAFGFVSPY